jgi:cholest-4-en-3-one 26-monooxygenase
MAIPDIDLMDPKVFSNGIPYDYFRQLRQADRLTRGTDTDGEQFWNVVRHRDVVKISRDTAVFTASPSTMTSVRKIDTSKVDPAANTIIAFLDGPPHIRLRKLTHKAFAPARVAALEPRARRIIGSLLAGARHKGEFDMATDVALSLPFEVFAEVLGVPDTDRQMVLEWARGSINLGDPDSDADASQASIFKLNDYFREYARFRCGQPGDDLFSMLLDARLATGQPGLPDRLTPDEVGSFVTMLITAIIDTVFCSATGAVLALLESGDQLELLRADRSLLPSAADEVLRWVTPVTHFARNVVSDTQVGGQPIAAGERVVLWYTSANRDERVFADPDRFDVARSPNQHLTFGGGGPHLCMGIGLATMVLRQFLDSVVDLLPALEITDTPVRPETNFMNGIKRLPMRFR